MHFSAEVFILQQKSWETWLKARYNDLFHRQIIFFSGSPQWSYQQALEITQSAKAIRRTTALWLGNSSAFTVRGFPLKQFKKVLGQESDIGVFDVHDGLHPSALLALSGTIRANGLLIICCPLWQSWPVSHSAINARLISYGFTSNRSQFVSAWQHTIENDPYVTVYHEDNHTSTMPVSAPVTLKPTLPSAKFASIDQQNAFESITKALPNKNIVILAKRGRGKSALLGMLADACISNGKTVKFCSLLKNNAATALAHSELINESHWHALDDKALNTNTDMLIIDEAANIPIQEILRLTTLCNQFILATTTDGYEGTGQGFINKLLPKLENNAALLPTKTVYMNQPLRYFADDTLEKHMDCLFHLNTDVTKFASPPPLSQLSIEITRNKHCLKTHQLKDYLNLLSQSHYQTTPDDIMRMLDSPDNFFIALYFNKSLVAVAVIIEEGNGRLAPLHADIASGERRPKGHQLAQKLSLLLSDPDVLSRKIWRINRIAVVPSVRHQGYGSYLLDQIETSALQEKVDLLGASFGQNESTNRFWFKNQYKPIHEGNAADKSTGETSLFVLKAITDRANPILSLSSLLYLRETQASNKEDRTLLKREEQHFIKQIDDVLSKRVLDYVNGSRSVHHMGIALKFWLENHADNVKKYAQLEKETAKHVALLNGKWIDEQYDTVLIQSFGFKGQKRLYQALSDAFSQCYWHIASV